MEQVHYFEGWGEGVKSFWGQDFADRLTGRQRDGSTCKLTDRQIYQLTERYTAKTDKKNGAQKDVSSLEGATFSYSDLVT